MYKGQLTGFPEEVVEKMLDSQVLYGNPRNAIVFEENIYAGGNTGFDWEETTEGWVFWNDVIYNKSFDVFFKRYPKSSGQQIQSTSVYPKVMMVSDEPITETKKGIRMIVFHYQPNAKSPYFVYVGVDNIKEIKESDMSIASFKYAKDIEPEPDDFPAELQVILDEKANNNNHIDLDAYAKGLLDCYNKLVKK